MLLRTAVDLFAGLGGNTEGARRAGLDVLVAANHWPLAVETHKLNHPDTDHLCQDLQQADFDLWPDFDVLLASPCCQGHSNARGQDKPQHDPSRATAWAVVACAEAKLPRAMVIENVPEFTRWKLFPRWVSCLMDLGYHLSVQILNAADLGVPQERERLFIVGVHHDLRSRSVAIPHGSIKRKPARDVVEFETGNWSPVFRPGRAQATLSRISSGRSRFGERFLAPFYGSGSGKTGRSLDRPIGTLTTRDRYALVDGDRMRMLTTREALQFQGFHPDYRLTGVHKRDVFMIGNAVPPAMPEHILNHLNHSLAS